MNRIRRLKLLGFLVGIGWGFGFGGTYLRAVGNPLLDWSIMAVAGFALFAVSILVIVFEFKNPRP